jgi:hypothetical protein
MVVHANFTGGRRTAEAQEVQASLGNTVRLPVQKTKQSKANKTTIRPGTMHGGADL